MSLGNRLLLITAVRRDGGGLKNENINSMVHSSSNNWGVICALLSSCGWIFQVLLPFHVEGT